MTLFDLFIVPPALTELIGRKSLQLESRSVDSCREHDYDLKNAVLSHTYSSNRFFPDPLDPIAGLLAARSRPFACLLCAPEQLRRSHGATEFAPQASST